MVYLFTLSVYVQNKSIGLRSESLHTYILILNVNLFSRSGLVMGLGNGFGALAGIFIPLTKDWIVGSPATCDEMVWR